LGNVTRPARTPSCVPCARRRSWRRRTAGAGPAWIVCRSAGAIDSRCGLWRFWAETRCVGLQDTTGQDGERPIDLWAPPARIQQKRKCGCNLCSHGDWMSNPEHSWQRRELSAGLRTTGGSSHSLQYGRRHCVSASNRSSDCILSYDECDCGNSSVRWAADDDYDGASSIAARRC
jgi:hypothetical protein